MIIGLSIGLAFCAGMLVGYFDGARILRNHMRADNIPAVIRLRIFSVASRDSEAPS